MSTAGTATAALTPAPTPRPDFPTWVPPMLVKELRQGMRTRGFVGAFVVFQLLMAVMMIAVVSDMSSASNAMARSMMAQRIEGFFWAILAVQMLIVTPARALASLQMEVESRTVDLLVLTRLSAWRIVVGKWISLIAQALLLLVAMLPYGIVRYFGGSVDLLRDAVTCASLIVGCGILTAAGLWGSGMPKIVRYLLPVGLVGLFIAAQTTVRGGLFGGGPVGGGMFGGYHVVLWYFDAIVMTIFFLVAAVRRIAPPAESHVLLARGAPLLTLLPVPLWVGLASANAAGGQLAFASVFLALVCAIELASVSRPMVAHWRPWAERGTLGRMAGRFVMPGWPSALLYALLVGAIIGLMSTLPGIMTDVSRWIWAVILALTALIAPVIVLSIAEKSAARAPGGIYVLVFGAMSTLAAIAAGLSSMFTIKYSTFEAFVKLLPVSSFWLSLGGNSLSDPIVFGQAVFVAAVLLVAMFQSRYYWREVALYEVRELKRTK